MGENQESSVSETKTAVEERRDEQHEASRESGQPRQQRPPVPEVLPLLPLRGTVVFPNSVVPITVGRSGSLRLIDETLPSSKIIGVVAQQDPEVDEPGPDDLHEVGVACNVLKLLRRDDGTVALLLQGLARVSIGDFVATEPFFKAKVQLPEDEVTEGRQLEAAVKNLRETSMELIRNAADVPEELRTVLINIEDPSIFADFLAANLNIEFEQRQDLLEQMNVNKRLRAVQEHVTAQLEIARLQQKIQEDVQSNLSDLQRRVYLREQLKAIQKELGEGGDGAEEQVEELRRRLEEAEPPAAVMQEADRELQRLAVIPPASPEYSVIVTYLETIADLPWNKLSEDNLDLDRAREILDRDHFDLDKVKRRLIEYLAVRKLNPEGRGPILCLLGPPGVGKTSLGQSIADALGRQFVRMSLGGIRDEAEIRGHRRTYIGAMPGRIIQEMRRAGTRNPVMMLDEIDKLGADFRGDPASALLEVLDPRQNQSFSDRYLDVDFDLSQVIFIATANYIDPVPAALKDRMEIISIPGYTDGDKLQIAKRYLVKRQLEENGLPRSKFKFQDAALKRIIDAYTREAGVRNLEREIGAVARGLAAKLAAAEIERATVNPDIVTEYLGPPRHVRETAMRVVTPGVVTGLAYTPFGGEVLFIEATRYAGKGNVTLTGQIGDVMRESVQAALSLVKSRAEELGIDEQELRENDLHVHVPAGAVPKDGPSAGIAMFTAMASLFTGRICRPDVAMTGELTLRGLVLPIGGVKEKSLAALRAGIKRVILPKLNEKDLPDVPPQAREKLDFVFVERVEEVLDVALRSGRTGTSKNRSRGKSARKTQKKQAAR
jgi:ATP-dependent Lon protease